MVHAKSGTQERNWTSEDKLELLIKKMSHRS